MLLTAQNSVMVGSKQAGVVGDGEAMISSCITCGQHAISKFQQQFKGGKTIVEAMIPMLEPVYQEFCICDDFGNKDTLPGKAIGIYEQPIQIDGLPKQYCFMLHLNMMPKQGVIATILSPSEYLYGRVAINLGHKCDQFQQYMEYQQQHQQQQ